MPSSIPSQNFVDIKEIRDGIIILKNGGLRAIVMTTSVNLALKSEEEQRATLFQFENFLNTLEFPTELVVQSRNLNLTPYLKTLEKRYQAQTEELLRIQTREYIEFIRLFVEQVSIMTKSFYIVVPYDPSIIQSGKKKPNPLDAVTQTFGPKKTKVTGSDEKFEFHRSQLEQRIGVIEGGISRFSLKGEMLKTEDIINLFHDMYNPGDTRITNLNNQEQ